MTSRQLRVLAAAAAVAVVPPGDAQIAPRTVADCGSCPITTARLFETTDNDSALYMRPMSIIETADRKLVVITRQMHADPPALFDSTGRWIGWLGARGSGPGETSRPTWLRLLDDGGIRVYSPGRYNDFDASGRYRTSHVFKTSSASTQVVFLPSGTIVATPTWIAAGQTHVPLTARHADGSALSGSAADTPRVEFQSALGPAASGAAAAGRFWVAERVRAGSTRGLRLSRITIDGNPDLVLEYAPPWWNREVNVPGHGRQDVPASVIAVREDDNGRVWVLAARVPADADNQLAIAVATRNPNRPVEGALLVIDRQSARLVGEATIPGWPVALLNDGRVATYAERFTGEPYLTVWNASLPR